MTTADLIAAIADLDPADVPAVLAAVAARLAQPSPAPLPLNPECDVSQLLTVPQAAALLGYRPSYLYEMLRRGDLPAVRDRKFVRIRQSAINDYISAHEQRGPLPIQVSDMLYSKCDRKGFEASAQSARTHPSRACRQDRSTPDNHREMGSQHHRDS